MNKADVITIKRPKDGQIVTFWTKRKPKTKILGYYVASEDLFMYGLVDKGDFEFRRFVKNWTPISFYSTK